MPNFQPRKDFGPPKESRITLFDNSERVKTNPKAPVMRGFIELLPEEVEYLASLVKAQQPAKLECSLWPKVARKDNSTYYAGAVQQPRNGAGPKDDFPL